MIKNILSAGVVILHGTAPDCRYLLLRSYRYWDFPKGIVETGESPFSAACREVREETSLDQLDFVWGHAFVETAPYGRGKVARYYLALSPTQQVVFNINPQLGHPEHHQYRWLNYHECRALLGARLQPVLDWARGISGC